jgi:hypothetical protein
MRKSRKPNHLSSSPHDTYTPTVECTVHKYRSSILVPVAQNRTLSTRTTRSASAESSVRLSGSLRLASLHVPLPTQHDQKKADAFACVHEPRRRTGWWFSVPGSDSCRAPILAPVHHGRGPRAPKLPAVVASLEVGSEVRGKVFLMSRSYRVTVAFVTCRASVPGRQRLLVIYGV